MKTVKILKGQTLVDIAMQELGEASRVMELAVLNGIKVTDALIPGQTVEVMDFDTAKRSVVLLFADDANKPASGGMCDVVGGTGSGISFWAIESDFVVQ